MNQEVHFKNIRSEILRNLDKCESDLIIAVAWFTDKKIIQKVNALLSEGVKVEIIIYDDHINKKELFESLYYNKARIYLSKKLMHNKFCVIDRKTVINGSYNWTINASSNDENIQITHDQPSFAKQFIKQFSNLASSCRPIDDFFDYSLSRINEIENEFENFYSNWPNYPLPYFVNTPLLKVADVNKDSRILKHLYFIKSREEERSYLWYHFILKSSHSLNKLLRIRNEKVVLPDKFDFVHATKWDSNHIAKFDEKTSVVEKHKTNRYDSSYNRYYIYEIDKYGTPTSEEFRFTYKLTDWLYIMHLSGQGNKPYFITKNLKKYPIKYSVWKILANKALLCSDYINFKSRLGLVSLENKVVIPFRFDNYVRNIHDTKVDEIDHVDFIEYPILVKDKGLIRKLYVDYNSYISKDHLIHRYSLSDYSLVSISRSKGKDEHEEFVFSSEEEYKYQEFYNSVITLLSEHSISVNEFDTLKSKLRVTNNTGYSNLKSIVNEFRIKKEVEAQFTARQQTVAKKEGCYVATMVYNGYDHPKVRILRRFRDIHLMRSVLGRWFIAKYYKSSPKFVKYATGKPLLIKVTKGIVDALVFSVGFFQSKAGQVSS
ncbi:phospholipase D-like domain-containing protein [Flagellimonas flava]|uniref:phospholipase D-like domain-containing protein n=1 Tax=Flagellimonas flava TaxID=570519 RepID=UPI003D646FC1